MWFSSRFPFLSVFNCTNTFICSVHTPTKCQEEEDKELPQQWKKRFIFPPLYSKWKPQWKFHILSLFLIETDAHWLRSLNMSLNSLNFQSCTVDVRQIFYFLQQHLFTFTIENSKSAPVFQSRVQYASQTQTQ